VFFAANQAQIESVDGNGGARGLMDAGADWLKLTGERNAVYRHIHIPG
jgi:hypothetical protein